MCECKGYSKWSKMLFVALLPVIFLAGCHGNFGWDRLPAPVGYPNKGGLDQSRQVDVGLEGADQLAEQDA